MRASASALALLAVLTLAPDRVAAQSDATFDDSTALMWGVGTFELSLVVTGALIAGGDTCQSWGCGILALLGGAGGFVLGTALAITAALTEAPSDIPFVVHHAIWSGLTTLTLSALFQDPSATRYEDRDFDPIPGLIAGAVVGLGMATYATIRRDELLRDPDQIGNTHFLTWAPPLAGLLLGLITHEISGDYRLTMVVGGLAALACYGAGIVLVETTRD